MSAFINKLAYRALDEFWPAGDDEPLRRMQIAWPTYVRAVLTAIREPSDGMIDAAEGLAERPGCEIPIWQAMIDKALEE